MIGIRSGHRWLIAAAALVALAAVACSGSGGGKKTPAAGGAGTVVAEPTATATVLPPDQATAVAARGAVDFVDYTDRDGRYTVKLPRGWPVETNTGVLTAYLPGGNPITASIGIYCLKGADIAKIQAQDQAAISKSGGGVLPLDHPVATKVGDMDAQQITFQGGIGGVALDRVFVYFVGNGCAWRFQMTVWPGTTLDELKPILDKMKTSFAFKS